MTTRSFAPILPAEARRALWDRLWRDVLLHPRRDHRMQTPELPAEGGPADDHNERDHNEHDRAA
jgi:hypothetical protein